MKKWLVALCMCLCLFSLTACGKDDIETSILDDNRAILMSQTLMAKIIDLHSLSKNDASEYESKIASVSAMNKAEALLQTSAVESWDKAIEDIGDVDLIYIDILQNSYGNTIPMQTVNGTIESNKIEVDAAENPKDGSIEYLIKGSKHDAIIEIVFERYEIKSITTNVQYNMGEKMGKAGLNTLLGMGTVFVILILISLIIALFGFIPKIQEAFKKDKKPESKVEQAVDNTIAQIVEKEELSDDTELVAVIAAAIASYESTSTDGFVVRSIRKVR